MSNNKLKIKMEPIKGFSTVLTQHLYDSLPQEMRGQLDAQGIDIGYTISVVGTRPKDR